MAFGVPGYTGRQQGNLAGGEYNDVVTLSQKLGFKPEDLVKISQKYAEDSTRFMQGVGQENLAFSRGLNADQMRQQQYNNMATNEQQNRFNAAQSLLNDYGQARNTAANLMASTLRF